MARFFNLFYMLVLVLVINKFEFSESCSANLPCDKVNKKHVCEPTGDGCKCK